MAASKERGISSPPEVKLVSEVTPREVARRIRGRILSNQQGGDSFIECSLRYCYVHVSRGMNADGKLVPSFISLNLPGAEGEIEIPLQNTGVVLEPDCVTFVPAPRPVKVGKEVKEVVTVATISRRGVFVSAIVFRPGSIDPNLEKAARLAEAALKNRAQAV